ncbi:MAG: hypothetical protein K0S58_2621 [Nitrospira sp.]|nr:hypothetical protein [Nitrospira sp.]
MPQALPGPTESGWTAESATLAEDDEMSSEVTPSVLCMCDTTFLLGMVGVMKHGLHYTEGAKPCKYLSPNLLRGGEH